MNLLSTLRTSLNGLIEQYETADGVGGDDYDHTLRVHAMAEGKYLSTAAELREAGLLGESRLKRIVNAAVSRLASLNVATDEAEAAWGLGFTFRDAPADEPYVITTAIVLQGLQAIRSDAADDLLQRGTRWLMESAPRMNVSVEDGALDLHTFSPHIPELIFNVAITAAATIRHAATREAQRAASWIRHRRVTSAGWPYAEDNPRIDLLHQCYILNALADIEGAAAVEQDVFELIGTFQTAESFCDRMTLATREEAGELARHGGTECFIRLAENRGHRWLVRHVEVARDWSLGELLVLLSRMVDHGSDRALWTTQLRRLLTSMVPLLSRHLASEETEQSRPRHAMHLAHGVASALRALRQQA